ncbi:MAG: YbaK/EbsC family protein [Acidobacteriota bacterium]
MSEPVLERILSLLEARSVDYERIDHPPASSAVEAAELRGTPIDLGVKAIFFKIDSVFAIFALSAERSLQSSKIARALKVRRLRFAHGDELREMTGLLPGAVPPFGEPVLPFPLYLDPSVLERESLVFTAGSRDTSLCLATVDYRKVARPEVFPFAR